jgi:phosphoglycolate phosphatase-like HAD superfamily hydrolase
MPQPVSDVNTQLAFSVYEGRGVFALLLGSGLSRAAGIPTGWEITLDLIRRVGLAQKAKEQPDWAKWYRQKTKQEPSYSTLLEELASSPEERRSILHSYIEPTKEDRDEGRKVPTAAHFAIADLVAAGYVRVIVTTNFDRLLENALRERGIEPTIVASADALAGAEPITHSACYILKLHGDYKDARILNTDAELTAYPAQYDTLLDRIFDEHGLIVCGWSGEWDHALRAALLRTPNRRYPVYWATRGTVAAGAQDLIGHRRARVVPIVDADSFFKGLRELVETLSQSQRQNPLSTELLVNTAKRYLSKPEFRIQLHELVEQETERMIGRLDSTEFSPQGPWDQANFRARVRSYESITEPLARISGALGRWGDDGELSILLDVIRTLYRQSEKLGAGVVMYINVRSYPAVLIFTAYALGLIRAERWNTLHQLFSALIDQQYREPVRAIDCLFLWDWKGTENEAWKQIEGRDQLRTPLSDHLLELFTNWGTGFAALTPDFELLFERFELLGALAYLEKKQKRMSWLPLPVTRIRRGRGCRSAALDGIAPTVISLCRNSSQMQSKLAS